MNEQQEKAYFDAESLKKLIAAEGRTVKAIHCYWWQNAINKSDVVELRDVVEIVFFCYGPNYRLRQVAKK